MRLDGRNVRFVTPFILIEGRRKKYIRLGRRRGNLHLQETALVVEGELLRFHYFGIELFFRRALSEWTTVTVPYSRIEARRPSRWKAIALALAVVAWVAFLGFVAEDAGDWAGGGMCGLAWFLPVLYLLWRGRVRHTVTFRGKDGKQRVLMFKVRPKAVRQQFLATLEAHRKDSLTHVVAPAGSVS